MAKPRILIVGVGRLGKVLARVVAPVDQAEIALFDTDTTKISHSFSLSELVPNAEYIFICTPSTVVRELVRSAVSALAPGTLVVSFVKGLDPVTGMSMYEVLQSEVPATAHVAVVGGPMLSGELSLGHRASGCVGTSHQAAFTQLAALFKPTLLTIEHSTDGQGVAMAGVLKNVYAIGLGMAAALELGDNVTGQLVRDALAEMVLLLPKLGGQATTAYSLAGLGDLVATGCSVHSRNRAVGLDLVTTGATAVPSEGLLSLPMLLQRLDHNLTGTPFLAAISTIVVERQDAREVFATYLGTTHS